MIVKEIMKTDLITVKKETLISHATSIIKDNKIRHLPVVDDEFHLIGVLSDRDLREAKPSSIIENEKWLDIKVDSIMSTNLITGTPDDFAEEAAASLYEFRIGCIPILSDEKLVGIVTATDLLYTFVQLTGAYLPSSRFELQIEDRPGILSEITKVFHEFNINIISALVFPMEDLNFKRLIIRAQVIDTQAVNDKLKSIGFNVIWPKM